LKFSVIKDCYWQQMVLGVEGEHMKDVTCFH